MRRGEIWWANLPDPFASEPGYRRPVLIVQADSFNRSGIHTVVAVIVTGNLRLAEAPGNVFLKRRETGLKKESVANVSQLVTIDKRCFGAKIGRASGSTMEKVSEGLRLFLSL